MIKAFVVENDRLRAVDDFAANQERVVWADLFSPTKDEETAVEEWIGVDIPTPRGNGGDRDLLAPLHRERRLLHDRDPAGACRRRLSHDVAGHLRAGRQPGWSPSAITSRAPSRPSRMRAEKVDTGCSSGETILIGLLEAIVDRLADLLERASREVVDHLARHLPPDREEGVQARPRFPARAAPHRPQGGPRLQHPGQPADAAAPVRLPRPTSASRTRTTRTCASRIKTLSRDMLSLSRPCVVPDAEDHLPARRDARHDQHRAERHHQDRLGRRRRVPAADAGRLDLRHEFRPHARAAMAFRLSVGARADGHVGRAALLVLSSRKGWL